MRDGARVAAGSARFAKGPLLAGWLAGCACAGAVGFVGGIHQGLWRGSVWRPGRLVPSHEFREAILARRRCGAV